MQVIALRPVVGHGGIGPHGAHNGYQDHGQQAAGEAHVVEVHAVLDFVCIGGEGRQHKADEQSHGDTPPQVAEAVRQTVADAVATQVGFTVSSVDVYVDGIRFNN